MSCGDMSVPFGVRHFETEALRRGLSLAGARVLVAGCGDGSEARYLAKACRADVTAVDITPMPGNPDGAEGLSFVRATITDLPFGQADFDAVFCHHVLEHVGQPGVALRELSRVLTSSGVAYVGTPNRTRAIGYIGSRDTTWRAKVRWNLNDFCARLRREFRNECGCHAGFSETELASLLGSAFTAVEPVTTSYMWMRYADCLPSWILHLLEFPRVRSFAYPSLYFWCGKGGV